MGGLLLRVLKIPVLAVTGITLAVAGLWAVLRIDLLLGLAGPFFGLALLGYTGYYLRSLL